MKSLNCPQTFTPESSSKSYIDKETYGQSFLLLPILSLFFDSVSSVLHHVIHSFMSMQWKVTIMHCLCVSTPYLPKNNENKACVLLDNSKVNEGIFVFSLWKVVFRCFEAPCEVWCKFTFSSVSYSHLFVYYPGCYLVDNVITYTLLCCLYTLVNITSENKYQSVIHHWSSLTSNQPWMSHRHHSKCLGKLTISRFEHNLELVCNLNSSKVI